MSEGLIGFLTGQGDSGAVVAADLILGSMPGLGIYADGRDLVSEIARLAPGGESPDYLVSSFALFGLATELPIFKGSADLVLNTAKVLLKQVSPAAKGLRTAIGRALGQAIQELDADAVLGFGPLMARMATDADFRHLSESMVKAEVHLARLNQAASRYGTDEVAAALLKLEGEGLDAGALREAVKRLSTDITDETVVAVLQAEGKFERLARVVAQDGRTWTRDQVAKYAEAAERISSDVTADFDEVLDVKGAQGHLKRTKVDGQKRLQLDDPDYQLEVKVAARIKRDIPGEELRELDIDLEKDRPGHTPVEGQVDVLTDTHAIEVKRHPDTIPVATWPGKQLQRLVDFARSQGVTPTVYFEEAAPTGTLLDALREANQKHGVVWCVGDITSCGATRNSAGLFLPVTR